MHNLYTTKDKRVMALASNCGTFNAILGVVGLTSGLITLGQPSQYGCPSTSFSLDNWKTYLNMSLPNIGGSNA